MMKDVGRSKATRSCFMAVTFPLTTLMGVKKMLVEQIDGGIGDSFDEEDPSQRHLLQKCRKGFLETNGK
jgi:hypothetical protein